jgi:hypothetical protein
MARDRKETLKRKIWRFTELMRLISKHDKETIRKFAHNRRRMFAGEKVGEW